jgi:hypothetical protein
MEKKPKDVWMYNLLKRDLLHMDSHALIFFFGLIGEPRPRSKPAGWMDSRNLLFGRDG